MELQVMKELTDGSLLLKNQAGKKTIFDKVRFAVPPRDNFRLELQKELKEVVKKSAPVTDSRVIKYRALEKYQGELYLARETAARGAVGPLEANDLEALGKILLEILEIMQNYHQAELVLGGLSLGQLKQDSDGKFLLQDPAVLNHLRHVLEANYRFDLPSEVIRGNSWNQQSDIFSWGQLAYRLLTGKDPFEANTPEERIDKVMRQAVLSPRNYQPRLSEPVAELIMRCLSTNPEQRPGLDGLIAQLGQIITENTFLATGEAISQFTEKARIQQKQYEIKERAWRWARRYGILTGVILAVALIIVFSSIATRPKNIITVDTKPRAVLDYYFQSVKNLDVSLLDETINYRPRPKNSFESLVINLFVINRTRQGMTQDLKDTIILTFPELTVQTLSESASEVRYLINYTLKINMETQIEYFERQDEFVLKPLKQIWRISEIKIKKEKTWTEKVKPVSPTPIEINENQ